MNSNIFSVLLLVLIGFPSCNQPKPLNYNPDITEQEIIENIKVLSADSLFGRKPGTKGDTLAANYIRKKFSDAKLKPLFPNYFQEFELVTDVTLGENNYLNTGIVSEKIDTNYIPLGFSANKQLKSQVYFVGYGFNIDSDTLQWNDYANIDVTGQWVLILRGNPQYDNMSSKFGTISDDRIKVLVAQEKGAAGVLFVSGTKIETKDVLQGLYFDKSATRTDIPAIQITRSLANSLLTETNYTIEQLETEINSNYKPKTMLLKSPVDAKVDVVFQTVKTHNVVGMVAGTVDSLQESYIVVGAHYDHLGMGGPGSSSRSPDTLAIHNGADDNASGISGIIELAQYFSANPTLHPIVFIAFSAEEMGLVGSKAFVKNSPIDLKNFKLMVNLDMIGRLNPETKKLHIEGMGTFKEAKSLIDTIKQNDFDIAYSDDGYGPSDQSSFYMKNIPVLFLNTGPHLDYHTPSDDWDKIDFNAEKKILDFTKTIIQDVSNYHKSLTFLETSTPTTKKFNRKKFKVTLGIMPDYEGEEKNGMRIDAVTKDKPAYNAGMKRGDIIIAMDGKKIGNIYDYMYQLIKFKPEQTISVDIMRNGQKEVLLVQF